MVSTLLLYLVVCKFLFVLNVQGNENCFISHAQSNNEWSQCSKTCGQGTKTIRRFVRKPEEIVNGGNCDGSTEKIKQCDTRIPCKSYGKQFVIFPCIPYIEM